MDSFQDGKTVLLDLIGLGKDALHIYVGLAVFLLTALVFRLPLRDWRPLAATLLVAILGEVLDLFERLPPGGNPRWGSSWHDLWNTMFWPLVLFLLHRWRSALPR